MRSCALTCCFLYGPDIYNLPLREAAPDRHETTEQLGGKGAQNEHDDARCGGLPGALGMGGAGGGHRVSALTDCGRPATHRTCGARDPQAAVSCRGETRPKGGRETR